MGSFGAATSAQTVESIEGSEIDFSKPITFSGGVTTAIDDTLAAIVLDDRNIANLSDTTPCMALQLGGDFDGSWRLIIGGGGGDATQTSFAIQTRQGGVWVEKASYVP